MIIDGKNQILGRLAVFAAKKAMEGEDVHVINCREIIITGSKKVVIGRYKQLFDMGNPKSGPFVHRQSRWIVKKAIQRMLPHKKGRGKALLKKIKCYNTKPKDLEDKNVVKTEGADITKLSNLKYVKIKDIIKNIGGKI